MRGVAFLDVLGFKHKIQTIQLSELATTYEAAISAHGINRSSKAGENQPLLFPEHPVGTPWCLQHIFSDSIILVSLGDDELSCAKLIVHTWRLTQLLIAYNMPVRGAMTYGEMHVNERLNVFLGKALTAAYELEQAQNWIGVALDTTLEAACPTVFSYARTPGNVFSLILPRYTVPFKHADPREMFTLNWRFNLVVQKGTRSLLPAATGASELAKIENTVAYLQEMVTRGLKYVAPEPRIPAELESFCVGDTEPPFPHGDDL